MKRSILLPALIFVCLFGGSCNRAVKGKIGDAEVTVVSLKKMTEFKFPGSGVGFGQPAPFRAEKGKELVVIELKADKEVKFDKAEVKDDKDQMYQSLFRQVFEFQDQPREISLLFEVPEHATVKTLIINGVSFDLSRVAS